MSRRVGAAVASDPGPPLFQGAVGSVHGLRGADGSAYVLKTYPPPNRRRAATEVQALGLLRDVAGVPVPALVAHGQPVGDDAPAYVVMTRLPGVRWADRRDELDRRQNKALLSAVGAMLRRLHVLRGPAFGDLLDDGPRWRSAWSRVDARCEALVDEHLRAGGPVGFGRRVRGLVDIHREAIGSCAAPVLCHNDFIGGNILVAAQGAPRLRGIVDLERASWDDPLADLAQTRLHAYQHDPDGAEVVVAAYGVDSDQEQHRIAVHEVLHALEERTWITRDRPQGWRQSIKALDTFLTTRT